MIYRYEARYYTALRRGMSYRPPAALYPRLSGWARRAAWLVETVMRIADAHGFDRDYRNGLVMHIDRRDISMETILAAVRYHAMTEYPRLLADATPHNTTALYASNLNDRYRVLRLSESERIPAGPLQMAIIELRSHLDNVPAAG